MNRYIIRRRLGGGTCIRFEIEMSILVGSVFLVCSTQTGKYYALKQIRVNECDLRTFNIIAIIIRRKIPAILLAGISNKSVSKGQ